MVVNQVSNNLNTTSTVKFSEFKQPQYGYYIQPELNPDDKIDKKKLWMKIGFGVLIAGLTSFGIVKAMPKSVIKKFDKFKIFLEKKVEEESTNSKAAIFYRTLLKTSLKAGEKFQGINNLVSFKDLWFKHQVTDRVPVVKKACNSITGWFDDISKFTVKVYYKSMNKKFKNLNELLSNVERELVLKDKDAFVTVNGQTKTAGEWIKILGLKREAVNGMLSENFSMQKVKERRGTMSGIMSDLEDKVWGASFGNKNNFTKKDTYFTFIADKFLAIDKANLVQGIHKLRSEISYNMYDKIKSATDYVILNKRMINPKDVVSEKLFRELNKQLSELKSCDVNSVRFEKLKGEIFANLDAFKESVTMAKDVYKYDDKIIGAVSEHNRIIKEVLNSKQKGTLDEMLEIYKQLLPEKEFNKLQKEIRTAVKSLDTTIKIEGVEYFDKLRDLTLGSAPTDLLTILLGFGSLGIGLASTEDKDTQASIALKYGIPAIGGMLTSMVVTSMLVSGLKSHFVGFISGLLLNKAGTYTDKLRRDYNAKQAAQHNQQEQQNNEQKKVC